MVWEGYKTKKVILIIDRQFVQIGQSKSVCLNITCGIPQGLVLGPILFTMYISDICTVTNIVWFVVFVHDTNIFCSGEHLKQLFDVDKKVNNKLKFWLD